MPEAEGLLAQKIMAEGVSWHQSKDSRQWFIRNRTKDANGDFNNNDTEFWPKIGKIEDKEGRAHGQNVQYGDLKLTVAGSTVIETGTALVTLDGEVEEQWNVYFAFAQMRSGICQERLLYARPKSQETS